MKDREKALKDTDERGQTLRGAVRAGKISAGVYPLSFRNRVETGEPNRMESVGSVLFTLYRGTPRHSEWMIACLEGAWPVLVGEGAARACRPLVFYESCLTIEITDPDWEAAVKGMKTELLDKIRTGTYGEVRQLRFRSTTKIHC